MNRIILLAVAALAVSTLSSCSLLGSALSSIMRLPSTVIDSVTEAETPDRHEEGLQPVPSWTAPATEKQEPLEEGVIVTTPLQ